MGGWHSADAKVTKCHVCREVVAHLPEAKFNKWAVGAVGSASH